MSDVFSWPPPYKIKRYRLARSVKLRASRAEGLIISTPLRFSLKHIPSILEENREWIITHLQEVFSPKSEILPVNIVLPSLGENWKISYANGVGRTKLFVRAQLEEIAIIGSVADQQKCRTMLIAWLRNYAMAFLSKELFKISQTCKLPFSTLTVRDQKTLWGSCTANATISLNYKLIFLPYSLACHVMLHELCHTQHHNHSAKFWQLVAKHDPNWREHKRQLRNADKLMPSWL